MNKFYNSSFNHFEFFLILLFLLDYDSKAKVIVIRNDISFCQFPNQQSFILPSIVIIHLNPSLYMSLGVRE
jgi:hypothetical protein